MKRWLFSWESVKVAVGILAVAATGYWAWRISQLPKENAAKLALGIEVEQNRLRLSWNKESPLIRFADGGTLSIVGANGKTDVILNRRELQRGTSEQRIPNGPASVRLKIYGAKGEYSESAHVRRGAAPLQPDTAVTKIPPQLQQVTREPESQGRSTSVRDAHELTPGASRSTTSLPPALTTSRLPKAKAPPVGALTPTAQPPSPMLEAPPPLASIRHPSPENGFGLPLGSQLPLIQPAVPMPPPVVDRSNIDLSPQPQFATALPMTLPRPIRQVTPRVPKSIRGTIHAQVAVSVLANIDRTGRVVRAVALDTGRRVPEELRAAAVEAAWQWQFEPARRGKESVNGQTTLQFMFNSDDVRLPGSAAIR